MRLLISWFLSTAASSLRSTFRILPRRGSTACVCLSRACLADPPALSPSTTKISVSPLLVEVQSASFPGSVVRVSTFFLRTSSRAFLAASAALAAVNALATTTPSAAGCASSHSPTQADTAPSTTRRTSGLPSRVLVCPSNSGLGTLTDTMAPRPSRMCSPDSATSPSFTSLSFLARLLMVRVSAALKPSRCVPPSMVRMELAKPTRVSAKPSEHHCSATSTCTPSTSRLNDTTSCSPALSLFIQDTNSDSPPRYAYTDHPSPTDKPSRLCACAPGTGSFLPRLLALAAGLPLPLPLLAPAPFSSAPAPFKLGIASPGFHLQMYCTASAVCAPAAAGVRDRDRARLPALPPPLPLPDVDAASPSDSEPDEAPTPGLCALNRSVAAGLRNASSLSLELMMSGSKKAVGEKIVGSYRNRTCVPRLVACSRGSPSSLMGPRGAPREKACLYSLPPRHTLTSSRSLSALTTDTPTPCSPPLTE
mmetsp:Transcript_28847/g.73582  ORF Transcript_28847/g.73582 Transcript_28847/m.73582 type:complete len:479 (+) Transcript_28847:819-2255(+)